MYDLTSDSPTPTFLVFKNVGVSEEKVKLIKLYAELFAIMAKILPDVTAHFASKEKTP